MDQQGVDEHLIVSFGKLCETLPPNILLAFLGALYGILYEDRVLEDEPIGMQIQGVSNQLGKMLHDQDYEPEEQQSLRRIINQFAYDQDLVDMRAQKKQKADVESAI
jgi:hypothetical protein